jgi:hypothetical protein
MSDINIHQGLMLCSSDRSRYWIVSGLKFKATGNGNQELTEVGMLELSNRTLRWRKVEEIENLITSKSLTFWTPIEI